MRGGRLRIEREAHLLATAKQQGEQAVSRQTDWAPPKILVSCYPADPIFLPHPKLFFFLLEEKAWWSG